MFTVYLLIQRLAVADAAAASAVSNGQRSGTNLLRQATGAAVATTRASKLYDPHSTCHETEPDSIHYNGRTGLRHTAVSRGWYQHRCTEPQVNSVQPSMLDNMN